MYSRHNQGNATDKGTDIKQTIQIEISNKQIALP